MSAPASASADPKEPKLSTLLAPLPSTRRGYGVVINASPKDGKMIYTNGRIVVIRSLENPSDAVIFSEHKCLVSAAVFSPSGYWVASGDVEGNVIIWSYPQMKVKNTFQIAKSISDLDWDADSTRIVAAGDGAQKARVFSWDSGNNLGEISMHSHPVISCSYRKIRPFRIATGSEDLTVNMYEGPPFKYNSSFKGHTRYPNGVRYSPNGALFASVGADSKVVVYDGSTGAVLRQTDDATPQAHKGAIYAFAWSPDNTQLLTASADKTAKVWNVADLSVVRTHTFGNDTLDQQVGALWSGAYLITIALSGAINYLDASNLATPSRVLHGHQTSIQSLAIDVAHGCFYTAGLTGEVCRWNIKTGQGKWLAGKGHGGKVVSVVTLNSDASKLLSFGLDDKVRVSAIDASGVGDLSADAGDLGGLPVAAASSPNDPSLAVAVLAQEKLVLLKGNSVVQTLGLGFVPTCVAFDVTGSKVFVGGKDKKVHMFEVTASKVTALSKTIDAHDKALTSLRCSPDGKFIASTDAEASVYITTLDSLVVNNKSGWRFHQAAVKDVDWSKDSSTLITSALDTHIILWRDMAEFAAAERTRVKDAHIDGANLVRVWDESKMISVGGDRTVKIWTLAQ